MTSASVWRPIKKSTVPRPLPAVPMFWILDRRYSIMGIALGIEDVKRSTKVEEPKGGPGRLWSCNRCPGSRWPVIRFPERVDGAAVLMAAASILDNFLAPIFGKTFSSLSTNVASIPKWSGSCTTESISSRSLAISRGVTLLVPVLNLLMLERILASTS